MIEEILQYYLKYKRYFYEVIPTEYSNKKYLFDHRSGSWELSIYKSDISVKIHNDKLIDYCIQKNIRLDLLEQMLMSGIVVDGIYLIMTEKTQSEKFKDILNFVSEDELVQQMNDFQKSIQAIVEEISKPKLTIV